MLPNLQNLTQLVLTGPYRAISADGCVAIVCDLKHVGDNCRDKDKDDNEDETPSQITVDLYDPSTMYDEAITEKVRICTCEDGPVAEIKYAVLSDAVESTVEAKFLPRERNEDPPAGGFYIYRIIASSYVGDVVLFVSSSESTRIGWSDQSMAIRIPLSRSVLAVPLTSSLTIAVELRGRPGVEIPKATLQTCQSDLNKEYYSLSFDFSIGTLEVNITCSD